MSLTALREICRDVHPSDLPPDIAGCLAGNKDAIQANRAVHRLRENQREENRVATHFASPAPMQATVNPTPATPDHQHVPPVRILSHRPAAAAVQPAPTLPLPTTPPTLTPFPTAAPIGTVHRTDPFRSDLPRPPQLPDPALSLCHIQTPAEHATGKHWESHVLFPEISPSLSCTTPQTFIAPSSNPQNTPCQTHVAHVTRANPPQQPRRAARIKTKRTATNDPALVSLEANDFFDIQLQYAEGREILSLIGAAHIPIPHHLIQPTQPLPPSATAAQPSNNQAQPSNNKAQPSSNKSQKNTGPKNAAKPPLPPLAQPQQALPLNPHDHSSSPPPSAHREGKEPASDDTPHSH